MKEKERAALIRGIMAKTHRDYRSKRGDVTHPSCLHMTKYGTTLVPLKTASDELLIEIAKLKGVALPGS